MLIDPAVAVVWDVLKMVVVPIKRQFGYVISSQSYAQNLQKEVGKLAYEAERIHNAAEVARNNLQNVYSRVMEWEASAEQALKEARDLLGDFEESSKTCYHGTLPDPCCHYQFSRKAKDKIKDIQQLAQEGSEFRDISSSDPAPGNVAAPTPATREGRDAVQSTTMMASASCASASIKLRDDGIFESRASIIQDIIDALANNSFSVVGVHGMGGVGKSTLLVDAEKRIRETTLFDSVAKADVSANPDIKRIQGEIAHDLGLHLKNEEFVSVRAKLLCKRLETDGKVKNVLIILDNLWERLDLKSVGIPCGHDNKVVGCKLLLTSRDRNVLQREMGCDKEFPLDRLKENEARTLFESMVGDKAHTNEFRPLVDEALHKCARLPLLIVTMAKHFKHAGLSEWRDALNQIERCSNEGISAAINKMLQLSYDHLKSEEAKSLLQLCVAYGVSEPSLENLVRYGYGMGIFQKDSSMNEARDRLSTHIHTLQASSLLLDNGGADGFKIHDLVHDFVAQFVLRDRPLLVLKDKDILATQLQNERLKSCSAICFSYIHIKELPKELDCPELRMFLLFTYNKSLEIPDSFFNSMKKLAVLNLTSIRLTHSLTSFQFLENLHTLCLQHCFLEDVAILSKLKGLQVLSFVNSNFQRLPKEIGQLTELRLLDLNHCSHIQIIEPGVLERLIKLEELYMENSFDQWNAMEQTQPTNANLIELNCLKNLCTLHVSIPDPSMLPEDLDVEKLTKYKIRIGNAMRSSKHKGSRVLDLKLDLINDVLRKGCIQSILSKTDDLFLDKLSKSEQSICALSQEAFPKLKHLLVQNSHFVHYILRWCSLTFFEMLESLHLENLVNLKKICYSHISSSNSFSTLKVIRVESCDKMEVLFPLSLLRRLPQLEEIKVVGCKLMRSIVEADDCGKVELCNLHALELRHLPNIKNFFTTRTTPSSSTLDDQVGTQVAFFNGQQISIPSLKSLKMEGLPNMKEIWSDESPLELSNLQFVEVVQCKSLSKVINSKLLVELHKLHSLCIRDCNSVQEIFDLDGPSGNGNVKTLYELTTLKLVNLRSLRCIWNKNPYGIVSFHNLNKLEVDRCNNLRFMFFPSMVKSLVQLRDLRVQRVKKMEAIIMEEEGLGLEASETPTFPMLTNVTLTYLESLKCFSLEKCSRETRIQDHVKSNSAALFNREVAFPSLETLHINDMDNIKMIWDNQAIADSFPKLKLLFVYKCNKFVTVVPSYILGKLLCLESLIVEACASLEVVFELQPPNPLDGHHVALLLKKLTLSNLPKLKCIWDKEIHRQVKFQCLRSISVYECKSLTSLFPASVARDLIQLEELEIYECGIVELIEKEKGPIPKFDFPKLTSLKLEHLIELKCIYTVRHALHWPALKTLEILDCNKVEILASQPKNEMPLHKHPLFFIEKGAFPSLQELKLDLSERMEIWHRHFHDGEFFNKLRFLELRHLSQESSISTSCFVESLPNLEELVVCESYLEDPRSIKEAIEGTSHELKVILPFSRYIRHLQTLDVSLCDGLSNMFTPTIAENLVALTKLKISNCRILTEVISDEEGGEGHVVAFNQLKYMELDRLARLRCFSSGGYTLMFPLLEDIIVNRCPKMKVFFEGPMEAPRLERVQTSLNKRYGATKYQYFGKGNLNTTIQNMFQEMATSAGTKFMRLFEFPELIGKWHSELNPFTSSWQLESLVVDKCPFINAIPSSLMLVLERMTSLQVHDCEALEEIFDLEGLEAMDCTQVLPQLLYLYLVNLPKLRQLWNKDLQGTMCFNSLHCLSLYKCNNLRHAFVPSMARCLPNLWKMEIKECDQMRGVIVDEEGQGSAVEEITFPNLKHITLERLPNLTSFISWKNHTLECPILSNLSIAHCPKIRSLTWQSSMEIDNGTPSLFTPQVQFPKLMWMDLSHMDNLSKIWTDTPQETLTFDCLWEVEVRNCKGLENLFPYWVATSLTHLGKLQVESCEIEEIVASGGDTPRSNTTQDLFPELTSLVLHDMPRLKSFYPNLPTLHWPLLEELRVTHCDKLNMLSFTASMKSWAQKYDQQDLSDQEARSSFKRDFPNLERLLLVNNNIQMIQDGNFSDDMFNKLKALTLACFHDKKAAFPSIFLLERFQNLQSLEVFCSSFEDLFPNEGLVEERKHLVLENLRELKLNKLHNLKCVWREDSLVSKILQSIETFEVWDCPCLTTIFPTETSFQNLTELVVKNSSGLVHLVTTSAVTNLVHLTYMTIIGCERMKEIVADDGNREGKVISFEKLIWLTLEHLPNLECFSSIPSCIFRFPSLWRIKVEECPKMKIFSKGTLSTPKLVGVSLFRYKWEGNWEEGDDLNTTIQKLAA
ncbi:hypothetical protein ACJRO7_026857 [Eucalyptus globulus]|uniref:NB-ARC domain-containing protein n=1 Tax=Eucalyptus globulus TaxID=34317 RepID=A0ABD3JPM1_EUCGL